MCKLGHDGFGAYAKGDGPEVRLWLEEKYPELGNAKLGRAELASRQDWVLEVSEKLHPLVEPLVTYTVQTLVLKENVLRDSVLQRLSMRPFEMYLHVCTIMWACVFQELRALTNSNKVELNPMELHDVFDHLRVVGTELQGAQALAILDAGYRPWPKAKPDDQGCVGMYADLEMNIVN